MAEFRDLTASLLGRICRLSGFCYLLRKAIWRNRAAILLYHDPKPDVIDEHLSYLKKFARIVCLPELWDSFGHEPLAVITIDDGAIGNLELRKVFQRHCVRPMLYLCTGTIRFGAGFWWRSVPARREAEGLKELENTERKKRLFALGFEEQKKALPPQVIPADELNGVLEWADLGAHTRFHPILTRCSDEECAREISESKDELAPFGITLGDFAYPNGDYSEREIGLVKAAGFQSARTCDPGWNGPEADRFRLKCLMVDDQASADKLALALTGLPGLAKHLFDRAKRLSASPGGEHKLGGTSKHEAKPPRLPQRQTKWER
jgi:peptidoglycan/xylan/chitin deacetylase (PgdA/CDA1 family)